MENRYYWIFTLGVIGSFMIGISAVSLVTEPGRDFTSVAIDVMFGIIGALTLLRMYQRIKKLRR